MFYKQKFGIDFGTDTIKIYDKKADTVTVEKNMIAVRNHSTVLAVGNEAYDMFNREALNTKVSTPAQAGRISDVWHAEAIIHSLLFRQKHYIGHKPSIYFAVPTDMTEIERRAYASIARRGRLRKCSVYLVEKPVADALALGLPIIRAKGSMMINMGAFSTELSAIADSHVILSHSVPIGGQVFNEEIQVAVRRKNRLQISIKKAEELKMLFANEESEAKGGIMTEGIDADSGLPREGFITGKTVNDAVMECINEMTDGLLHFLERIPPQVRKTIAEEGIYLMGGSSRIRNIAALLSEKLGYQIISSDLYEKSTINGLKEVISYEGANKLAYTPMQRK